MMLNWSLQHHTLDNFQGNEVDRVQGQDHPSALPSEGHGSQQTFFNRRHPGRN